MSKLLRRGAFTIAPVVVGALALGIATAHAETCGLKMLASFPMQDDPIGRLVIPVTVDHTTEHLIVDTGSFANLLSTDTVRALKMPTFDMNGVAYSMQGRITQLATGSLDIGVVHTDGVKFLVTDPFPRWNRDGIAGVIGAGILTHFDLDLDFASRKVNWLLQDHCPGQVVYWTRAYAVIPFDVDDNGHIELPVTVDGVEMNAQLDTGTTDTVLTEDAAARLPTQDAPAAEPAVARPARTYTMTFGSVGVRNAPLHVTEDTIGRNYQYDSTASGDIGEPIHLPDVLIGNDVLRQLHVYIAYKEKKIYVTAAGAH